MTDNKTVLLTSEDAEFVHALHRIFRDDQDLRSLQDMVERGVTIKQMADAWKGQRYMIATLKGVAVLIATCGAAWAVLKGFAAR